MEYCPCCVKLSLGFIFIKLETPLASESRFLVEHKSTAALSCQLLRQDSLMEHINTCAAQTFQIHHSAERPCANKRDLFGKVRRL